MLLLHYSGLINIFKSERFKILELSFEELMWCLMKAISDNIKKMNATIDREAVFIWSGRLANLVRQQQPSAEQVKVSGLL